MFLSCLPFAKPSLYKIYAHTHNTRTEREKERRRRPIAGSPLSRWCAFSKMKNNIQASLVYTLKERRRRRKTKEKEKILSSLSLFLFCCIVSSSRKIYTDSLDFMRVSLLRTWVVGISESRKNFLGCAGCCCCWCCCSSFRFTTQHRLVYTVDIYHTCYFVFCFRFCFSHVSRCSLVALSGKTKITTDKEKEEKQKEKQQTTFAASLNTCQRWLTLPPRTSFPMWHHHHHPYPAKY